MRTSNIPRTRAELHWRATTYEVLASTPAGILCLGFTARPSKHELLRMARVHVDQLLPHLTDADQVQYSTRTGLQLGVKVRVYLSGRTERECADEHDRAHNAAMLQAAQEGRL